MTNSARSLEAQARPLVLLAMSGPYGWRLAYVGGPIDTSVTDERGETIWFPTLREANAMRSIALNASWQAVSGLSARP